MAAKNTGIARSIGKAVKKFDDKLIFYGLSGSVMITMAKEEGLKTANEVFADRTYQPDGSLTPRTKPNALIENEITAVLQAMQMIKNKTVTATNGTRIKMEADTVCIHGDGKNAVPFAKALYNSLQQEGISILKINK